MLSTCDRHISLLNLIEKSPEEYSLVKTDRGETAGRGWFPKFLLRPWNSLFSFLFRKFLEFLGYFMQKLGLTKKIKII